MPSPDDLVAQSGELDVKKEERNQWWIRDADEKPWKSEPATELFKAQTDYASLNGSTNENERFSTSELEQESELDKEQESSEKEGLRLRNALECLSSGPPVPQPPPFFHEEPIQDNTTSKWDIFEIHKLWPEWKDMIQLENLKSDVAAGLIVSMLSLPLALGIAIASHAPLAAGIISSVVAGAVAAVFGGNRYAVTGPAAACALLVATIVDNYGMSAMVASTLVIGILQLCLGITRLAGVCKFIPLPVITGFTSGIGAVILLKQLPTCFFINPNLFNEEFHELTTQFYHLEFLFTLFKQIIQSCHLPTVILSLIACGSCLVLPSNVPSALIGIGLATGLQYVCQFSGVPLLGALPPLSAPSLPNFSSVLDPKVFGGWFMDTFLLFGLATLETLLSHTACDKLLLARGITYHHDPHLDMKGQGLANIIGAFFGGLPSTAVIARSSANVMSGARSRASAAFIVSGFTLASVLCLQPFLKQLPTCALSGVLVAIGIKMIINQETRTVLKVKDWTETLPMVSAFVLLVVCDLLTGVAVGIAIAAVILGARRLFHKTPLNFRWTWLTGEGQLTGMELAGSLTFFSLSRTEEMVQRLHRKHNSGKMTKIFKIDCSKVVLIDLTSLEKLITGLDDLTLHGYKIEMIYLPAKIKRTMLVVDSHTKKYFSSPSHTLQTMYH